MFLKMLDVSTLHITKDTREWLDIQTESESVPAIAVYDKQTYGWFLPVSLTSDYGAAVPSDLLNVLKFAGDNQCSWVMIDCDGTIFEELEKYPDEAEAEHITIIAES